MYRHACLYPWPCIPLKFPTWRIIHLADMTHNVRAHILHVLHLLKYLILSLILIPTQTEIKYNHNMIVSMGVTSLNSSIWSCFYIIKPFTCYGCHIFWFWNYIPRLILYKSFHFLFHDFSPLDFIWSLFIRYEFFFQLPMQHTLSYLGFDFICLIDLLNFGAYISLSSIVIFHSYLPWLFLRFTFMYLRFYSNFYDMLFLFCLLFKYLSQFFF